ncbi:hypothetical protein A2U01_0077357, partial [Trifolium medium]|nr:hypothetical protein [Trifolium medium]
MNHKPKCPKQSSPARRADHPCASRNNQKQNHPRQLKATRCAAYPRAPRRCQKKKPERQKTRRVAPHSWACRVKDRNFRKVQK